MVEIQSNKKVQFVSLISRNDRPLYIQSFDDNFDQFDSKNANKFLQYNFLSHMALDIFASPSSLSFREQQQNIDDNGGVLLLFIQDDVAVYGYETNNGLKIILGLGNAEKEQPEDNDETKPVYKKVKLKDLFALIHKRYLRTICNPFANLQAGPEESEAVLQSPSFDKGVKKLVDDWNNDVVWTFVERKFSQCIHS